MITLINNFHIPNIKHLGYSRCSLIKCSLFMPHIQYNNSSNTNNSQQLKCTHSRWRHGSWAKTDFAPFNLSKSIRLGVLTLLVGREVRAIWPVKIECWSVGDNDLTGAEHVLTVPVVITTVTSIIRMVTFSYQLTHVVLDWPLKRVCVLPKIQRQSNLCTQLGGFGLICLLNYGAELQACVHIELDTWLIFMVTPKVSHYLPRPYLNILH